MVEIHVGETMDPTTRTLNTRSSTTSPKIDNWKMATTVDHHCDKDIPSEENWEDEVEEDAERFENDPSMGMQCTCKLPKRIVIRSKRNTSMKTIMKKKQLEMKNCRHCACLYSRKSYCRRNPPSGMSGTNKNQKKNYKRKYDRQRQRMQNQGVTVKRTHRNGRISKEMRN